MRNKHLAELSIEEEGTTARLLNCLGEASQVLGNNSASLEFYREALDLADLATSDMLEAYYGVLTAPLEGDQASREAQLQLCMKALESFPLDAQLLCRPGGYFQAKDLLEFASRAYQLAATHGQTNHEIWHLDGLSEIALGCYTTTLQLLGRVEEAVELLNQELAKNPRQAA